MSEVCKDVSGRSGTLRAMFQLADQFQKTRFPDIVTLLNSTIRLDQLGGMALVDLLEGYSHLQKHLTEYDWTSLSSPHCETIRPAESIQDIGIYYRCEMVDPEFV